MSTALKSLELPEFVSVGERTFATEPLLSADDIQSRVWEMGAQLAEHYADRGEVHVLTVMNGALHFASDLRRAMQSADPTLEMTSDQVKVASYAGMQSSGVLRFQSPPTTDLKDRDVLVVEDIFDSGLTLKWLMDYLGAQDPASLEVAVAINKQKPSRPEDILGNTVMHTGFEIADEFVIGYGLDYEQRFRDLGGIYVLSEPVPTV